MYKNGQGVVKSEKIKKKKQEIPREIKKAATITKLYLLNIWNTKYEARK